MPRIGYAYATCKLLHICMMYFIVNTEVHRCAKKRVVLVRDNYDIKLLGSNFSKLLHQDNASFV